MRSSIKRLRAAIVLALAFCQVSRISGAGADSPFKRLATSLAENVVGQKVTVGVGNFVFENTEMLSPLSSMLRDELEADLGETGKFSVVTRDRLAELQNEGKFQAKALLEPGTGVTKVSIEGITGIVRGRFYAGHDAVTVYAELVWLEGGEVKKSKVEIPLKSIGAQIWPNQNLPVEKVNQVVAPQNMEKSAANIEEITSGRIAKIPHQFHLEIFTTDAKRAYQGGENISFRVRSDADCYVAVFCHQSDGSTTVLFPNYWAQNTFIPADKTIDIPGTHKSGFEIEIGPPFGSDVVQVVACSKRTELERMVQGYSAKTTSERPFFVATRGMVAKGIDNALGEKDSASTTLKWAEAHIIVSSFPKQKDIQPH